MSVLFIQSVFPTESVKHCRTSARSDQFRANNVLRTKYVVPTNHKLIPTKYSKFSRKCLGDSSSSSSPPFPEPISRKMFQASYLPLLVNVIFMRCERISNGLDCYITSVTICDDSNISSSRYIFYKIYQMP